MTGKKRRKAPGRPTVARVGREPQRRDPRTSHPTPEGVFAEIVREAVEVRGADALEAELWASSVVGLWRGVDLDDGDPDELIGEGLVAYAARSKKPAALAVLRALEIVGPDDVRGAAAEAADTLAAAGIEEPAWHGVAGRAVPVGAAVISDVFGDGCAVLIGFEYPDGAGPAHTLDVYVDNNIGRIAKDAFVGGPLDEMLAEFEQAAADEPAMSVARVEIGVAAERIRSALDETDVTFDPPVSDTYREVRPLLDARLPALPSGPTPETATLSEADRELLVASFLASPEVAALQAQADADGEDVEDIAWQLVEFRLRGDGLPLRWSPVVVELCLLDWFAGRVAGDDDYMATVPAVVRAWVSFAGRQTGLDPRFVAETLDAVDEFAGPYSGAVNDPETWHPAKTISMRMLAAGVDLDDPDAISRWLENEQVGADGLPGGYGEIGDFGDLDIQFDDEDDEAFIEAWEAAEREAVDVLRDALAAHRHESLPDEAVASAAAALRAGVAAQGWPHIHVARAAGWGAAVPLSDVDAVLEATGAFIAMKEESGLDVEMDATLMALDFADWLGAVIGLVRGGPGTSADPEELVRFVAECPELEGEPDVDFDGNEVLAAGFDLVLPAWQAAGVVDDERRLTALGAWVLPRALARSWGGDFDRPNLRIV